MDTLASRARKLPVSSAANFFYEFHMVWNFVNRFSVDIDGLRREITHRFFVFLFFIIQSEFLQ